MNYLEMADYLNSSGLDFQSNEFNSLINNERYREQLIEAKIIKK